MPFMPAQQPFSPMHDALASFIIGQEAPSFISHLPSLQQSAHVWPLAMPLQQAHSDAAAFGPESLFFGAGAPVCAHIASDKVTKANNDFSFIDTLVYPVWACSHRFSARAVRHSVTCVTVAR